MMYLFEDASDADLSKFFLVGSKHAVSKTFSFEDAKKLHVKLVREFNVWAQLYHTNLGLDASSFQEIYPVDYLERN